MLGKEKPVFLTDGGLETTLLFHEGWDLPEFAAFPLLDSSSGRLALRSYYKKYTEIAEHYNVGFVLSTPTWRASSRWGQKLGYNGAELDKINRFSVEFMRELLTECSSRLRSFSIISGQLGPQDDGYSPKELLTAEEAQRYHRPQIESFAEAQIDQIEALTFCSVDEAVGVCRAASEFDLPVIISFTVEQDGRLVSGESLQSAIERVDLLTDGVPAHYMVNCAHPDHFKHPLAAADSSNGWLRRIGGVRANASRKSHAELDAATAIDDGNPHEFGRLYSDLRQLLPGLWVLGGCCGTDHRHIKEVARVCAA